MSHSQELVNLRFEVSILRQQLLLCDNSAVNLDSSQFIEGIRRRDEKIVNLEDQIRQFQTTLSQSRETIMALYEERRTMKEEVSLHQISHQKVVNENVLISGQTEVCL